MPGLTKLPNSGWVKAHPVHPLTALVLKIILNFVLTLIPKKLNNQKMDKHMKQVIPRARPPIWPGAKILMPEEVL